MKQIALNPTVIARILGVLALMLILASLAGQVAKFQFGYENLMGLVPLFNVDGERNIPAFFSTLLLVFASLLLAVLFILNKKTPSAAYWAALSLGFLVMTYDEAFSIHENLVVPIQNLLGEGPLGIFYFAWVIPGITLVLALTPFFVRFWFDLDAKTRLYFFIAAVVYLGGSLGVEMIGGRYVETHQRGLVYCLIVTFEESLEMLGLILFIRGLLGHLARHFKEIKFTFDGAHE